MKTAKLTYDAVNNCVELEDKNYALSMENTSPKDLYAFWNKLPKANKTHKKYDEMILSQYIGRIGNVTLYVDRNDVYELDWKGHSLIVKDSTVVGIIINLINKQFNY